MTGPDPRAGREAARLLAAAQDWVRTSAPHLAPTGPDGEPCSCPVCRAVAGLRDADPEALGRWVDTAVATVGTLIEQAEDLLATRTGDGEQGDPGVAPGADERRGAPGSVQDGPPREAPAGDTPSGPHPHDGPARQDGPRPRAVRRVTISRPRDEGTSTSP